MRTIVVSMAGLALGLLGAVDAAAQSRVILPIIVGRPAATPAPAPSGPTSTTVTVQGSRGVSGFAGGSGTTSFGSTATDARTFRVTVDGPRPVSAPPGVTTAAPPASPASGPTTATRVTIQDLTGVGGFGGARSTSSFGSTSPSTQNIQILTRDAPGQRDIRIFVDEGTTGSPVETPIVIFGE